MVTTLLGHSSRLLLALTLVLFIAPTLVKGEWNPAGAERFRMQGTGMTERYSQYELVALSLVSRSHDEPCEVTATGDAEAIEAAVRSVQGVSDVRVREPAGDEVSLTVRGERDLRAEVAEAVVGGGFGLLRLDQIHDELESIFLDLTSDGHGHGPDDGDTDGEPS